MSEGPQKAIPLPHLGVRMSEKEAKRFLARVEDKANITFVLANHHPVVVERVMEKLKRVVGNRLVWDGHFDVIYHDGNRHDFMAFCVSRANGLTNEYLSDAFTEAFAVMNRVPTSAFAKAVVPLGVDKDHQMLSLGCGELLERWVEKWSEKEDRT